MPPDRPPREKEGKKPAPSGVLPGEFGMVPGVNHRDVIEACQRGDEEAFRVLFDTHKDRVYSIALRYAGDFCPCWRIALRKRWTCSGRPVKALYRTCSVRSRRNVCSR